MSASGEILNEEFLKPLGLTANALAKARRSESSGHSGETFCSHIVLHAFRRFTNRKDKDSSANF